MGSLLGNVPAGHPRLFMRPETLAAYRAGLATTYAEPWTRLKAICRKLIKNVLICICKKVTVSLNKKTCIIKLF